LPLHDPEKRTIRITTWETLIKESCQVLRRVSFTLDELKTRFKECSTTKVVPQCLEDIIDHMYQTKQIQPENEFNNPIGWGGWIISTVLAYSLGSKVSMEGRFILVDRAKELATKIYQRCKDTGNHLLLVDEIREMFQNEIAVEDFDIIIATLIKNKYATIIKISGNDRVYDGIKFSTEITEADEGVLHMKIAQNHLVEQKKLIEQKN